MTAVMDSIQRLELIGSCLEAVTDLTIPEGDLHVVNRDKLAQLLMFLAEEHQAAIRQLTEGLRR